MAMQYSTTLRNNQLDQIEATVGTSAKLQLWSGALPANCAAADAGTLLCEMALPSDWMAAAGSGSVSKTGAWNGNGTVASGTGTNALHFRIKDTAGTTCHIQGTITGTGLGGDMTLDNVNIAYNQAVTVNTFTINAGNG